MPEGKKAIVVPRKLFGRDMVKFAVVFLLLAASASESPTIFTSRTLNFPKAGPVLIEGTVKQGHYPRLSFHSQENGRLLLDAEVGRGSLWKEVVGTERPNNLDIDLRFTVLHRPGLPDPLIVALARRQGGSDCGYNSAIFGEVNGRLLELTPSLPDHWMRGQVVLSRSREGQFKLTVTSERYQPKDVHYAGPSRMALYVYSYDREQGKFVEVRHSEVNSDDLHEAGEDLSSLFGEFAQC